MALHRASTATGQDLRALIGTGSGSHVTRRHPRHRTGEQAFIAQWRWQQQQKCATANSASRSKPAFAHHSNIIRPHHLPRCRTGTRRHSCATSRFQYRARSAARLAKSACPQKSPCRQNSCSVAGGSDATEPVCRPAMAWGSDSWRKCAGPGSSAAVKCSASPWHLQPGCDFRQANYSTGPTAIQRRFKRIHPWRQ